MYSKRFYGIHQEQWIASGINVYNKIYIAAHDKENFNAITVDLSNAEIAKIIKHLTKILEANNG